MLQYICAQNNLDKVPDAGIDTANVGSIRMSLAVATATAKKLDDEDEYDDTDDDSSSGDAASLPPTPSTARVPRLERQSSLTPPPFALNPNSSRRNFMRLSRHQIDGTRRKSKDRDVVIL